ncbi:AAA family ATPase [Brumicola pallidula]|uniref:HTH cro/C1-type domain-containing protein n=1 Tax=Brumicola pallidula DSM 14239 = ACAM 615 TaxID=1121922 RepID=K6ZJX4_9ALTE|nr:AAA family ATPase [Glaciecola pallidula]GAC30642.1 hypothetical protein GPAL_3802 [Glaciecola pallidula DSM 14239 = ACAM 615]
MTNSNNAHEFNSGKILQKLRELQGLSIPELAKVLDINSTDLMKWESDKIPSHKIQACSMYFEVPVSLFNTIFNNKATLNNIVESHLYAQPNDKIQQILKENSISREPQLNLSGLALNRIPPEVFEFSWLQYLDLSNNNIKRLLPSELFQLPQLKTLNISANLITYLPGILIHLDRLTMLDFRDNPMSLQPNLLQSAMNFDAFKNFVYSRNMTLVIFEPTTGIGHTRYDALSAEIEKKQPLLLTTADEAEAQLSLYKEHINSILYLTPSSQPKISAEQLKTLLQPYNCHMIIYTHESNFKEQYDAIRRELILSLPSHTGLIYQTNTLAEFIKLFADIQRGLTMNKPSIEIKFEKLILENIGAYEHLTILLNPKLTVLIGLNGAGKTTILRALALATLGPEHAGVDDSTAADLLRITGNSNALTQWEPKGLIKLEAKVNGKSYTNTINILYNSDTEKVEIKGQRFSSLFDSEGYLINLIIGISEQRNTNLKLSGYSPHDKIRPKVKDLLPLINGEEQACIAQFSSWLSKQAFDISQGDESKQVLIDIIFAVFSALTQEDIKFAGLTDVEPPELWIEHQDPKQRIPLRLASQGYQAVMGWIGFILKRMFEAYEYYQQPLLQSSIIIIDEIDQLLHVKWQQKIINVLANQFFPNCQWIITTHSPMVVNGLDQDQVLTLQQRGGVLTVEACPSDLWLWQYGDVVNYLFNVPQEQPKQQEQQLLQDIAALNDIEISIRTEEQQQELNKLELRLEKTQKSLAFVNELYSEQQRLHEREQELAALIEKLTQK